MATPSYATASELPQAEYDRMYQQIMAGPGTNEAGYAGPGGLPYIIINGQAFRPPTAQPEAKMTEGEHAQIDLANKTANYAMQQGSIDSATARYIADQQLKLGQQQFDLGADLALAQEGRAGEQYQRYKDMYLPNEEEFAAQSRYGTPTGLAAHRAGAGVTQQMNRARGQMAQQLAARGITPGSPAYANAMRQVDIAEATGRAGAMDAASNQERSLNFAKKQNLVNIGRGMPSEVSAMAATATPLVNNAAQYYGQAGQGVANAANISQGATGQALSGYQTGLSALQNASSGARDWWNMQQNAANQRGQLEQGWAKLNQQQTDSSGWGGLLGTLATKIPW